MAQDVITSWINVLRFVPLRHEEDRSSVCLKGLSLTFKFLMIKKSLRMITQVIALMVTINLQALTDRAIHRGKWQKDIWFLMYEPVSHWTAPPKPVHRPGHTYFPLSCWIVLCATHLPIFICSILVVSMYFQSEWKKLWILIRWLCQKPADQDQ